jgi:hypothetical protein
MEQPANTSDKKQSQKQRHDRQRGTDIEAAQQQTTDEFSHFANEN